MVPFHEFGIFHIKQKNKKTKKINYNIFTIQINTELGWGRRFPKKGEVGKYE